jgi:hypothetical protein
MTIIINYQTQVTHYTDAYKVLTGTATTLIDI